MNKKAFTLAEILIVLGIIGIVAELTIPTLMNNVQDKVYKVAYKKAFSEASQALMSANNQDLTVDIGTDSWNHSNNFAAIMNQFKTSKQCLSNNTSDCWDSTGELMGLAYSSGGPGGSEYAFIDNSGTAWTLLSGLEGRIGIDTNGFKKPNEYGKDRFVIVMQDANNAYVGTPAKIVPWGDEGNATNGNICYHNKCDKPGNHYYGTSWLYN